MPFGISVQHGKSVWTDVSSAASVSCPLPLARILCMLYCSQPGKSECHWVRKCFMGFNRRARLNLALVFSPSPASSGSGQALHRRGHSPLGAGRLRHLGQTPRGKPRARDGTASIQKFTPAGYFRPTRKQLLPLAPGFLRKHRQWGGGQCVRGKAKFRTGLRRPWKQIHHRYRRSHPNQNNPETMRSGENIEMI